MSSLSRNSWYFTGISSSIIHLDAKEEICYSSTFTTLDGEHSCCKSRKYLSLLHIHASYTSHSDCQQCGFLYYMQ